MKVARVHGNPVSAATTLWLNDLDQRSQVGHLSYDSKWWIRFRYEMNDETRILWTTPLCKLTASAVQLRTWNVRIGANLHKQSSCRNNIYLTVISPVVDTRNWTGLQRCWPCISPLCCREFEQKWRQRPKRPPSASPSPFIILCLFFVYHLFRVFQLFISTLGQALFLEYWRAVPFQSLVLIVTLSAKNHLKQPEGQRIEGLRGKKQNRRNVGKDKPVWHNCALTMTPTKS